MTADGHELFVALGQGFSLVTVDPVAAEPFRTAAERLHVPLEVVLVGPDAATELARPQVLVRPDQFVAWAGDASTVSADRVLSTAVGH